MMRNSRWMVMVPVMIAALGLSACTQKPADAEKIEPAVIEPAEGTEFNRVVLTERAAERLDIQIAPLREEQILQKLAVTGQVLDVTGASHISAAAGEALGGVLVRVSLDESDLDKVDRSLPANILPLTRDEEAASWMAQAVELMTLDESEDMDSERTSSVDFDPEGDALYYVLDSAEHSLVEGESVLVELTLLVNGAPRKVVPYAAVIYGLHGETWVYTSPEPLTFVRQPIVVDYIEADLAVLVDGPPAGTLVVTVGVAELYGVDAGVGQ